VLFYLLQPRRVTWKENFRAVANGDFHGIICFFHFVKSIQMISKIEKPDYRQLTTLNTRTKAD
jgi:hypothetical protein